MNANRCYLGDSVYVDNDGYLLRLTTENGLGPTNEIYLEPDVFQALLDYVERERTKAKEQA